MYLCTNPWVTWSNSFSRIYSGLHWAFWLSGNPMWSEEVLLHLCWQQVTFMSLSFVYLAFVMCVECYLLRSWWQLSNIRALLCYDASVTSVWTRVGTSPHPSILWGRSESPPVSGSAGQHPRPPTSSRRCPDQDTATQRPRVADWRPPGASTAAERRSEESSRPALRLPQTWSSQHDWSLWKQAPFTNSFHSLLMFYFRFYLVDKSCSFDGGVGAFSQTKHLTF